MGLVLLPAKNIDQLIAVAQQQNSCLVTAQTLITQLVHERELAGLEQFEPDRGFRLH